MRTKLFVLYWAIFMVMSVIATIVGSMTEQIWLRLLIAACAGGVAGWIMLQIRKDQP